MKRPILVTWMTTLALIHVGLISYMIFESFNDPYEDVRLSAFVPRSSDGASDWGYAFHGLHNETSALCGPPTGCKEGYSGDRLTLLRFEYKDKARAYAGSLGSDGYQSGWIVADFSRAPLDEYYRRVVRRRSKGRCGSRMTKVIRPAL
ncbi:hypothetical protein SPF06_09625 [Sinomonas sp. JGH33]|uniref:Uncharacterized protein n=1 Tax=Sinomonas terricola TaxID=3110330 RepID=A0ABU5T617_9MICC|nr:hypothetical protein [Sinomonas sp. JGH33]MEA5454977.1 hypothetical protein [Sinomonas sp. JGH33]